MKEDNMDQIDENCKLIGYSIRSLEVKTLDFHKPGCQLITMDGMLCSSHAILDERTELGRILIDGCFDIRYSFKRIKELYSRINKEDRQSNVLYGYAIGIEYISRFYHGIFDISLEEWYSEIGRQLEPEDIRIPKIRFCGFDVLETGLVWLSTLSNCSIDWKIAEESGPLNQHNLFENYLDARAFAERCSDLVEEHYPCVVWGIYKVEEPY